MFEADVTAIQRGEKYIAFEPETDGTQECAVVDRVAELVQSMTSRPTLIRMDAPRNVWLITPRGVRWVDESPRSPVAG